MNRHLIGSLLLVTVATIGCSSSSDKNTNDSDLDMIPGDADNCPFVYNPDQAATVGDAHELGDVCDDEDADTLVDVSDNCILIANPDQLDTNGNGVGDVCEVGGRASLVAELQTEDDFPVRPIAGLNGKLYFRTYDTVNLLRTWVYDTQDSSAEITELDFEVMKSFGGLTALNDKLYFCADDDLSGNELWVFDPARPAVPPVLVADINPGVEGSDPCQLMVLGDKLYFPAYDSVHGTELWMYDPSQPLSGAILVADINPTSDGSSPRRLMSYDGKLHFFANNGSSGLAPWVYVPGVGASSIGHPLPDIEAPPFGQTVILNDKLYFRWWMPPDIGRLWAYDLTNQDSGLVEQADVPGLFGDDDVDDLISFNEKLFFSHTDPSGGAGLELWMFDPENATEEITLAADIYPGRFGGRTQYPDGDGLAMVELGGKLYMNADNSVAGHELMAYSDTGSMAGVSLIADINPGPETSRPLNLFAFDNKLYFSADDGVHGQELWEYDPAWQYLP